MRKMSETKLETFPRVSLACREAYVAKLKGPALIFPFYCLLCVYNKYMIYHAMRFHSASLKI